VYGGNAASEIPLRRRLPLRILTRRSPLLRMTSWLFLRESFQAFAFHAT
jgi:hypothetical protein